GSCTTEAVGFHQLEHGLAARKFFDRSAQVSISLLLPREKGAEQRQTSMQIKAVKAAKDRRSREGKFENKHMTIFSHDPRHFPHSRTPVLHVPQREAICR